MSGWSIGDYLLAFVGLCLLSLPIFGIIYWIAERGSGAGGTAPPERPAAAVDAPVEDERPLDPAQVLRGAHRLADDIAAATLAAAGPGSGSAGPDRHDDAGLFAYAIGTTIFFARATGSWSEDQSETLFGAAAADPRSRSRLGDGALDKARTQSLTVAEALHGAITAQGQGQADAFFDFATLHLIQIFPEARALMAAGAFERFSDMIQAFGQATLGRAAAA